MQNGSTNGATNDASADASPGRPRKAAVISVVLGAVLLALLAFAAIAWGLTRPISLTVDGVRQRVAARATIGDLDAAGYIRAKRGALLSVKGELLRTAGGKPRVVYRNGVSATADQRVYDGDVITSSAGADVTEATVTSTAPIPMQTRVEGKGAIVMLSQPGAPGVKRVVKGAVSGIEITSTVVQEPVDMVLIARQPTGKDKLVALTFDDGPWPNSTLRILSILKQNKIKATFFEIGRQVKSSPGITRSLAAAGMAIGNHSWSHADLSKAAPNKVRNELEWTSSTIRSATGKAPTWVRPPYGAVNGAVYQAARRLKLKVILWDGDSRDWTRPGAAKIVRTVERQVRPGAVVLLHDGGGNRDQTVKALPQIIRDLRARGYNFVTVDELEAAK